ncbi:FkbM family methyltransferase [Anabaena sp. CCY 0017]|uniref:FkbM family methyltransferase n=1 Tax=Anabaena sp. CCY 0017 TaxID=3103866 RepID=UPI0039C6E098
MDESLRRWDVNSELAALKSLQQYLQPNDIFIDVGANFGLHTLYAAKLLEHQGQVFAFEPVISNLKLLQRNITLNSLNQRVTIVSKAVSNSRQKSISFYLPSKDMTVTASLNQTSDNSLEIEVENTRLDDYWQAVDLAIKLIKIDVEGAELEVLRGAENILKKWHPVLVIEVHGFALPEFGSSVNELRNFLSNLGYEEKRLEGEQFDGDEYFQAVYTVN